MGVTEIRKKYLRHIVGAAAIGLMLGWGAASLRGGAQNAEGSAPAASPAPTESPAPSAAPEAAHGDGVGGVGARLLSPIQGQLDISEQGGICNILLIGTDELLPDSDDAGRGDVTMLCSLNKDSGEIKLVSFERSVAVPWAGHGDVMLTNSFTYGGAALTTAAVENCFRIDIDGYVHVDFDGFCRLIDAIGGVDVELTREEAEALTEDAYTEVWFSEGMNHLDGEGALRLCRLRRIDDNWQRVERQRRTMQAVFARARTLRLGQLEELTATALDIVDTDLTPRELAGLLLAAPKFRGVQAQQLTIPDRDSIRVYDGYDEGVSGCDYGYESRRLHEFIYGAQEDDGAA